MLWMFTVVQKYLQIPAFYSYDYSACSPLFKCVVVKLDGGSNETLCKVHLHG